MFGNSKLKALLMAGAMAGRYGVMDMKRGGAVVLGPIGKLPDKNRRNGKKGCQPEGQREQTQS